MMITSDDLNRIEGEFLRAFLRDGSADPICVIIAGGIMVDAIPVSDRDLFAIFVRRRCREANADTVVIYAEAWVATDRLDRLGPRPRPWARADREVLMVYTEAEIGTTMRTWPIIRVDAGVSLGVVQTGDTLAGGGFDNLLGK